ncbi:hypothetical protein Nepgr_021891 [Nepenthes gracilis]|uniref:J domain-containing protein n=1 Tax=Nepenthes gracilis TaxID=150966 RepID=A0AAD3SZG2_NEPGR|nr:hypothetical protein Nepgr_021891 [Nepenthes gracilis]
MDSNKDEAFKCISIAKEAIASGNKERALKFIKFAERLNHNLSVDDLLTACENLDSAARDPSENGNHVGINRAGPAAAKVADCANPATNYTEEHVHLIRKINQHQDYYAILGVEKTCSVEEIRKSYRKLSLKVHPDKNKAPGAEDAFKKVCKAFKCLSEEDSRRQYDQTGLVDEFEYKQQHNVRHRSRATNDLYDDEFDPDEIFKAFFGQGNMFQSSRVFRSRGMGTQNRAEFNGSGPSLMVLLQLLPFLAIILLAYLPSSEPEYSLQKNYSYKIPRATERYGVEFYVKSADFDRSHPVGSAARSNIEEDFSDCMRVRLRARTDSRQCVKDHSPAILDLGKKCLDACIMPSTWPFADSLVPK